MSNSHSITHWIEQLKDGEASEAQQQLWNRYFRRLVGLARLKLGDVPRRSEDEEDVALSALNSFFVGARSGRFPQLSDRNSLWPLLAKITIRKAINQREKQLAQKRGARRVRGDSVFPPGSSGMGAGFDQIIGENPEPVFADRLNEECCELLKRLDDDTLRLVARRKLEGYTNAEIAKELGVVVRTVDRKLDRIRSIWSVVEEE